MRWGSEWSVSCVGVVCVGEECECGVELRSGSEIRCKRERWEGVWESGVRCGSESVW